MARVNTNNTSLRYSIESAVGTAGTSWRIAEFENITSYGATISTVVRRPVSEDRGRKKGTITDLDSNVEFDTDLTLDAFTDFVEGFVFAEFVNVEFELTTTKLVGAALDVTGTGYALGAQLTTFTNGDLLEGKLVYAASGAISLFFAEGYALAANNGLKPLNADILTTSTEITISGLSVETAPTNASLQVAGVRTDDLMLTIDGGLTTGNLTSAANVDWTVLGLKVGQEIHIGSATSAGVLQNSPTISSTVSGYARITAITALVLDFDKPSAGLTAEGAGSSSGSETVDVMFGRFARNVPVTAAADDNRFLERTYHFETSYPDLGGVGTDEYEYAAGNYANEITLNLPLTDKSTINFGFIGTTSEDIVGTGSRKTGASAAISPLRTTAINTSSDIVSITTDVVSAVSDVCFKSLSFTLRNNVTPEKCLGTLGASFVNSGIFEVDLEGQMLFTDDAIVNAVRNNTTVTFQAILRNDNGAICIDIPELTLGNGGREFPQDASVMVNITGASFTSNTYGYDVGISLFALVPYA